jgi:threonine dehydrogenase-like Zn-dependent dehydrogenase
MVVVVDIDRLALDLAGKLRATVALDSAQCGVRAAVLKLTSGRGAVNVDTLISAVGPLSEGPAWSDRLYRREPGLMKVILEP